MTAGLGGDLERARADINTGVGLLHHFVPALLSHGGPLAVQHGRTDGGGRQDVSPVGSEFAVRGELAGAPVVQLEIMLRSG